MRRKCLQYEENKWDEVVFITEKIIFLEKLLKECTSYLMVGEGGSWRNEKEERKDRTIGSININGVYERDRFERTEALA